MSTLNDLIRRAKAQPAFVTINANQVGTVAEHIRAIVFPAITAESARAELIGGNVKIMGVPIRVLGARQAA